MKNLSNLIHFVPKDIQVAAKKLQDSLNTKEIKEAINEIIEPLENLFTTSNFSLDNLIKKYLNLRDKEFEHIEKGTKYILLDVVNTESTDQTKFPVSVVYYDKQLKTKWCRPLIEFNKNFKLTNK